MLRLGIHYVEPRRLGFFIAEEAVLWGAWLIAASLSAWLLGRTLPPWQLAAGALVTGGALEFGLSLADLHDLKVARGDAPGGRRLLRVVGSVLLAAALVAAAAFRHDARLPPIGAGIVAASLAALASRAALPWLERRLPLGTRAFLVGDGNPARRLLREIARDGRVEVVGFCGPRAIGIAEKARNAGAEVVVTALDDRVVSPVEELLRCRTAGFEVVDAALFAARALHRLPVELVQPGDLIYGDGFARPLAVRIGRRALSVGAALVLLVLAAPLLAAAALLIKLDSPGTVLFRQLRVGEGGRTFEMLKLRTMIDGAESPDRARWAASADPRITRVGRVLRRFRVDELPQLVNVLRGEMELVGPRPERPQFVDLLRRHIAFYDLRHLVPPGITGWAQIRCPYAASIEEAREKLQYDLYYVRHLGIGFDFFILLLTARTVLLGRGAR